MKVKELIKILKKMPQNLPVGFSAHDNSEWEIAEWISSVDLFDKSDIDMEFHGEFGLSADQVKSAYDSLPKKAVVLR